MKKERGGPSRRERTLIMEKKRDYGCEECNMGLAKGFLIEKRAIRVLGDRRPLTGQFMNWSRPNLSND